MCLLERQKAGMTIISPSKRAQRTYSLCIFLHPFIRPQRSAKLRTTDVTEACTLMYARAAWLSHLLPLLLGAENMGAHGRMRCEETADSCCEEEAPTSTPHYVSLLYSFLLVHGFICGYGIVIIMAVI